MIPSIVACLTAAVATSPDASSWLEKAVAAHGGRASVTATQVYVCRAKVSAHFGGRDVVGSGTLYREGEKQRTETTYEMRGAARDFISTWNGEESWREGFGRRSEQATEPARVEARNQPLSVLKRAVDHPSKLTLDDVTASAVRLTLADEFGKVELVLDPTTALLRSLTSDYPHQSGLDEVKIKRRVDSLDRWTPTPGGPFLPWESRTEIDGVLNQKVEIESVEASADLDDALFQLEADSAVPLPGDELAD